MVKNKHKTVMSNRLLYTLIAVGILAIAAVMVYAAAPSPGHSSDQIDFSTGISGLPSLIVDGTGIYGDIKLGNPADFEFDGGTDGIFYFSNTGVSTGKTSFRVGTTEQLTITNTGKVGIGTTNPTSALVVNGDAYANKFVGDGSGLTNLVVRVQGADPICDSTRDGLLKYKNSFCSADDIRSSTFDICMRTGDTTYSWYNLRTYTWTDAVCDTNGCPSGEQYYTCTNPNGPADGCYSSESPGCYCDGTEEKACPF